MNYIILVVILVFIKSQQTDLFFLNIEENNEIQLYRMDLNNFKFEKLCNFGSYPAVKQLKDYDKLNVGGGVYFHYKTSDVHEYTVFLHNNEKDRKYGSVMRCDVVNKTIQSFAKVNISCEIMDSQASPSFSYCASTLKNDKYTKFYMIGENSAELVFTIPYFSKKDEDNTFCCFNRFDDSFICKLYDRKNDEFEFIDIDLGTPSPKVWVNRIRDVHLQELISFNRYGTSNWMAIIENNNIKGFGELKFDSSTYDEWYFTQIGISKNLNHSKKVFSNTFTGCETRDMVFIKIIDENGNYQLLKIDYNTGEDFVVDTSEIGNLEFISQFICL